MFVLPLPNPGVFQRGRILRVASTNLDTLFVTRNREQIPFQQIRMMCRRSDGSSGPTR